MSFQTNKTVLRDLSVREAMRVQVVALPGRATIDAGIRYMIKYKIAALLITDERDLPVGVVSKTDVMGAYYALLPTNTSLEQIMNSPPLFCSQEASLESALETMRARGVYRLYVSEGSAERILGVLAYPDIVGLLYQYCRGCEQSLMNRRMRKATDASALRLRVKDVMTPRVMSFSDNQTITEIMEGLSVNRFGAVLIMGEDSVPSGVISKTDLILAYRRGVLPELQARSILSSDSVRSCGEEEFIEDAIRTMIFSEIHRLFVYRERPDDIVGVFSLSDAARIRSGSCHACVGSRIKIEDGRSPEP
jgi:predicted transcriptional regulator